MVAMNDRSWKKYKASLLNLGVSIVLYRSAVGEAQQECQGSDHKDVGQKSKAPTDSAASSELRMAMLVKEYSRGQGGNEQDRERSDS